MEKLTNYTLGFIFNKELNKVLLIQFPNKGKWNDGFINGVGGHIDKGETPLQCMMREAAEEADFYSTKDRWNYAGMYDGTNSSNPFKIYTFYCQFEEHLIKAFNGEEGSTNWYTIENIPKLKTVSNLQWMVPFCIAKIKGEIHGTFHANYVDNSAV